MSFRTVEKVGHVLPSEACLSSNHNIFLVVSSASSSPIVPEEVSERFFGTIIKFECGNAAQNKKLVSLTFKQKVVYLFGDVSTASAHVIDDLLHLAARILVIREGKRAVEPVPLSLEWNMVGLGRVPLIINGVGVYYRRFFETNVDYFTKIQKEHNFQSLTESNKTSAAYRKGIYITKVRPDEAGNRHFKLLRCSTNLSGATDNMKTTDEVIVRALNNEVPFIFKNAAPLDHILAQVYWNSEATADKKSVKAKIKAHSDKTKDMPQNGIMAFCTFYSKIGTQFKSNPDGDPFDKCLRRKTSILTNLRFKLKKSAYAQYDGKEALIQEFSVTLFPESVFFMSLSTNRLYTHAIVPSALPVPHLPTRMGYVVRCSKTSAVHIDGQNFIEQDEVDDRQKPVALEQPTIQGVSDLKGLYRIENSQMDLVEYGNRFTFSLNKGDYSAPMYDPRDEFQQIELPSLCEDNIFNALLQATRFEGVCRGRRGTVLVHQHKYRGTPIVRTTTKYTTPAQCFDSIHQRLAKTIEKAFVLQHPLNNALIETYDNTYFRMGAHTDQAQDLHKNSYIAVFSCYKEPNKEGHIDRTLVIEPKNHAKNACRSKAQRFEIPMRHNSVILWSLDTNRRFRHKIVLDKSRGDPPENIWLGVTFRTSMTYVNFKDGICYLENGKPLKLMNEDQRGEFYKLRGKENKNISFDYPDLTTTLSPSDLMPPTSS